MMDVNVEYNLLLPVLIEHAKLYKAVSALA